MFRMYLPKIWNLWQLKFFLNRMKKLLIFLVFPLILSGCFGNLASSSKKTPKEDYVSGQVIKDFPPVPLYPKAGVIESYGYKNNFGASFMSGDDLEKVIKFYKEALGTLGWENSLKKRSETNFVFIIKNKNYTGELIVNTAADGKKTAITTYVSPR